MSSVSEYQAFQKILQNIPNQTHLVLGNVLDEDDSDEDKAKKKLWEKIDDLKSQLRKHYSLFMSSSKFPVIPLFDFLHHETKEWTLFQLDQLDVFVQGCEKSKFGDLKQNKTVLNENVRCALETKEVRPSPELLMFLNQIKLDISHHLFGQRAIRFDLNKVNIYLTGGFFQKHVDTPRENVMGTLIIQVPGFYQGGEFALQESGRSSDLLWECVPDKMEVIAFYSHLPHEVRKVQKGTRITLSFYIVAEEKQWHASIWRDFQFNPHWGEDASDDALNIKSMQRCIQNVMKTTRRPLGFLLDSKYSLAEQKLGLFKGISPCVMHAIDAAQIRWRLVPIVMSQQTDENGKAIDELHPHVSRKIFRFTEQDIHLLKNGAAATKFAFLSHKNVLFVDLDRWDSREPLISNEMQAIEFTGNESQEHFLDNRYFCMAVILGPSTIQESFFRRVTYKKRKSTRSSDVFHARRIHVQKKRFNKKKHARVFQKVA